MQVHEFACPGCRARLRLKGRSSSARKLDCPDCNARFVVRADDAGAIEVRIIEPVPAAATRPETSSFRTGGFKAIQAAIRAHPSRVAWSATTVLVMLLISWLAGRPDSSSDGAQTAQAEAEGPILNEAGTADSEPAEVAQSDSTEKMAAKEPVESTADDESGSVNELTSVEKEWHPAGDAGKPVGIAGMNNVNAGEGGAGQTALNTPKMPAAASPENADTELERGLAEVAGFLSGGVGVTDPLKPDHSTATKSGPPDDQTKNGTPTIDGEQSTKELPEPVLKTAEEFEATLTVMFVEYKQAEPVSLKYQLAELNEMLDVPFVLSEDLQNREPKWWDQTLLVSMQKCTVQDIMSFILKEAGLVSDFRDGELHLDIAPEGTEGQ